MDNNLTPISPNINFEDIKKIDQDGFEYWEARELMVILEYTKWSNFENVIEKAKSACTLSGQNVADHFADIGKVIKGGKGAIQSVLDYKLSRYACYLIAQNGDPTKPSIALAQTYFAAQTRKQELFENLTDDEKRLLTRDEVTNHNKKLFKTAQDSGVRNFGKFNDAGYKGLYGRTSQQIQQQKRIGKDKILDRAGATELAANLFRITQTDEQLQTKLHQGEIIGESGASKTHFIVGGKVRKAIKDIGGTMPEELPAQEHIDEVKKRIGEKKPSMLSDSNSNGRLN
ncbi:DNA damage-inducible protein D [bacterium]|nr:DNA damage-inducible protein D [bacterium]